MAKTRSMARNQNHDDDDDDALSNRKRSKSCARWSDLDHNILFIVMMQLGFGDYYPFRGVCKSWRSLACSNEKKFMTSMPPMSITIYSDANEKVSCYLEDFEGRKFKTILPWIAGVDNCVGVTCGYLISFNERTLAFMLVNPITRKQLHFHHFPSYYDRGSRNKAIYVFSPSISAWVFVVLCGGEIYFSKSGTRVWKHVPYNVCIHDIYAFKGKIYTLACDIISKVNLRGSLCELVLEPEPKFTVLCHRSEFFIPKAFVSSGDNLYVRDCNVESLYELDVGEMKWVKPCEKTMEEYALFHSYLTHHVVAVRRESWADSRSHGKYAATYNNGKIKLFNVKMWYFPHQYKNVDCID